jgi:magnesium chelatase family protein
VLLTVLARVSTFALDGLEARRVWVEVDIRPGLPAFAVVGLGDTAVRESRERVRAAVQNSGFEFPMRRIVANLAPAYLPKVGPGFDLALAVGVLAASGQVSPDSLAATAVYGELSLGGELRASRGTLAVAEGAVRGGLRRLVVARGRGREAALVAGLEVVGVESLGAAVAVLAGGPVPPLPPAPAVIEPGGEPVDLADVDGQGLAVRALTIAAAGGHNLLLTGPPGTGKTMLARRLPGILPPLSGEEAVEVTRVHSVAGLHAGGGLVRGRPFRAPHHSTSSAGLTGGGSTPTPGEVTLAHHGVLFLDELAEFPRSSLEALRQPLEDGHVTVVRSQRAVRFPARFALVGATNPCPCGLAGAGDGCRCTEADHARYRRRLSGPLLDRMDLVVAVERPRPGDDAAPAPASAVVRDEVCAARERQARRRAATGAATNAHLGAAALRSLAAEPGALSAAEDAYRRGLVSARGRHRALRVARTLADLAGRERVTGADVGEALALRSLEPAPWAAAAA